MSLGAEAVAAALVAACELDVSVDKPGNVSDAHPGHGMTAADFRASAQAIAPVFADPAPGVGRRVRRAVAATWAAVGCNTNLGICLLAAPLADAALRPGGGSLRERVVATLAELTVADAEDVYAAIRQARPAGIGRSEQHDVAEAPAVDLRTAMVHAAPRDRIGWQYGYGFGDVFERGVATLAAVPSAAAAERTLDCYLAFLSAFPDSHIVRKHGEYAARAVQQSAISLASLRKACENPRVVSEQLA
ncbi:MAG: triphosphoribosyl-dephospho-CoA synthase, partial [Gammaproteobacteria bacterium]|nr:triphosphoribosyl-dephospho-CoA synthase [Gammaproteobacteria bacterium]